MRSMHLPTLRQLQFLVALSEEGSFSRAAERCHVTQPTLSSAIKEVETMMGVQLVEREARGASLTRAGEEAVRRARVVLAEAHDLMAAVNEAAAPLTGLFRLGAIPTIAPYVLPKTLRLLKTRYPQLKLKLREDVTDRLVAGLRARTLDAALIALPWDAQGIETEVIADDEFLLVAPEDHRLVTDDRLTPDDLAGEDVLLLEDGHCLRDHALAACALPLYNPEGTEVSATSLQTLVQMVAGGMGVSLLPRLAADRGIASGSPVAVRAFSRPLIGRSIGIAWRTGSPLARDARLVGAVVAEAIGADGAG